MFSINSESKIEKEPAGRVMPLAVEAVELVEPGQCDSVVGAQAAAVRDAEGDSTEWHEHDHIHSLRLSQQDVSGRGGVRMGQRDRNERIFGFRL